MARSQRDLHRQQRYTVSKDGRSDRWSTPVQQFRTISPECIESTAPGLSARSQQWIGHPLDPRPRSEVDLWQGKMVDQPCIPTLCGEKGDTVASE